jgi:hypothetical protein
MNENTFSSHIFSTEYKWSDFVNNIPIVVISKDTFFYCLLNESVINCKVVQIFMGIHQKARKDNNRVYFCFYKFIHLWDCNCSLRVKEDKAVIHIIQPGVSFCHCLLWGKSLVTLINSYIHRLFNHLLLCFYLCPICFYALYFLNNVVTNEFLVLCY